MAKTNTRKYIIYGSIATIVGVIGYYIWKSSKKDEKPKDETPSLDNDGKEKDGKVNETPVKDNKTPPSDGRNPDSGIKDKALASPTGFDEATGNKFRVWFNDNYPEMAKAFDLDRSGLPDNSNIRRALYKYSAEWKKYVASQTSGNSSTVTTPVKERPKIYALFGASIWSKLTDFIPYRRATVINEYVGESLGIVKHNGVEYYKLAWDRGEVKYIAKYNVSYPKL
jgi:hypothetical protein